MEFHHSNLKGLTFHKDYNKFNKIIFKVIKIKIIILFKINFSKTTVQIKIRINFNRI